MFSALFGSQEQPERPNRKPQLPPSDSIYPNISSAQHAQPNQSLQSRPPPPPHRRPDGSLNHHPHHDRHDSDYQPHFRPVNRLRSEEPTTRYPGSQLSKVHLLAGNSSGLAPVSIDPALLQLPPPMPELYFQNEERIIREIEQVRQIDAAQQMEWEERCRAREEPDEEKLDAAAILSSLTTTFSTTFQPQPRVTKRNSLSESVSNVFSGLRGSKAKSKSKGEAVDEYGVVPSSMVREDSDDGQESTSHEEDEQKEKDKKSDASNPSGQQSSWYSSFLPASISGDSDVYDRLRVSSHPKSPPKNSSAADFRRSGEGEGEGEGEGGEGHEREGEPNVGEEGDGLTKSQRRRVKEFSRQTEADQSTGLAYLMQYDWDLELCIARFYADHPDMKGRGAASMKEDSSVDYVSQAKELSNSALVAASDLSQRFLSSWRGNSEDKNDS